MWLCQVTSKQGVTKLAHKVDSSFAPCVLGRGLCSTVNPMQAPLVLGEIQCIHESSLVAVSLHCKKRERECVCLENWEFLQLIS